MPPEIRWRRGCVKKMGDFDEKGDHKFSSEKKAELASRLIEAMLEKAGIGGVKDAGTGGPDLQH